jgi:hypothetical protein
MLGRSGSARHWEAKSREYGISTRLPLGVTPAGAQSLGSPHGLYPGGEPLSDSTTPARAQPQETVSAGHHPLAAYPGGVITQIRLLIESAMYMRPVASMANRSGARQAAGAGTAVPHGVVGPWPATVVMMPAGST